AFQLQFHTVVGSAVSACSVRPECNPRGRVVSYKELFWMACDSTEQLRAEYGPFHTRNEAELEARKLGFGFLLRYEHIIGETEDIQDVRSIFIELPQSWPAAVRIVRH